MDSREIIGKLGDENAMSHPAWGAFKREMRGRQYGREPLNDAWHWFTAGWDARQPQPVAVTGPRWARLLGSIPESMVTYAWSHRWLNGKEAPVYGWCVAVGGIASDEEKVWLRANGFEYAGGKWCRADRDDNTAVATPIRGEATVAAKAETFYLWWERIGRWVDPDTSDVPWFEKRRGLAEQAFDAGRATSPGTAAPPKVCGTCNGQQQVGGLLPNGGGYDFNPCPDCTGSPGTAPTAEEGGS